MLTLDLAHLSNAAIEKMVTDRCTHLGNIKNITIHRDSFFEPQPFVLVEMNSPIEVHRVIREIGDCTFGSAALVRLVQDSDQCSLDADISRFGSAPASQAHGARNSST